MSVDVDASQLRNLGIEITLDTDTVGEKVATGMKRIGFAVERDAKLLAPVDTGNLRASISTDISGSGAGGFIEVAVSATTAYADYVEYGTSRQAPQPFMNPAFDRHAPEVADVLLGAALDL